MTIRVKIANANTKMLKKAMAKDLANITAKDFAKNFSPYDNVIVEQFEKDWPFKESLSQFFSSLDNYSYLIDTTEDIHIFKFVNQDKSHSKFGDFLKKIDYAITRVRKLEKLRATKKDKGGRFSEVIKKQDPVSLDVVIEVDSYLENSALLVSKPKPHLFKSKIGSTKLVKLVEELSYFFNISFSKMKIEVSYESGDGDVPETLKNTAHYRNILRGAGEYSSCGPLCIYPAKSSELIKHLEKECNSSQIDCIEVSGAGIAILFKSNKVGNSDMASNSIALQNIELLFTKVVGSKPIFSLKNLESYRSLVVGI